MRGPDELAERDVVDAEILSNGERIEGVRLLQRDEQFPAR